MSVVPMQRLTVIGKATDAPRFVEELQSLGAVELIPHGDVEREARDSPASKEIRHAVRILLGAPLVAHQRSDASEFDAQQVTERVLNNRKERIRLQQELDELRARVVEVGPWGDFEFSALEDMGGIRLWFYVVPAYKRRAMRLEGYPWKIVHQTGRFLYVVVLSPVEPAADRMPVERSRVGTRSLETLRAESERLEIELEERQAERIALTRWIALLVRHIGERDDEGARESACASTWREHGLFAVSGWVPENRVPEVRSKTRALGLACHLEPPDPDDEPPVLLHNAPVVAPGEDLIGFYQMPGYRDWDPSPLVYLSFVVFFAMILADAGYSAVLGVSVLCLWRRLGRSALLMRIRRMTIAIVGAGFAYGVVVGSYFGVEPTEGSLLHRFWLLDAKDSAVMMPLSLGIGTFHLICANVAAAYTRKARWSSLASLGWALAIGAGFATYLGGAWGTHGMGLGLAMVFVFSSERPVSGWKSLTGRALDGLVALTGASRAFGDTLSYLRLFALGLASVSLASTFNRLGVDLLGSGIGLLLALVVFLVGHSLNLALGLIGGVVHGLRLNVIELYNWSVFDEGRAFRPFRRRESQDLKAEAT